MLLGKTGSFASNDLIAELPIEGASMLHVSTSTYICYLSTPLVFDFVKLSGDGGRKQIFLVQLLDNG